MNASARVLILGLGDLGKRIAELLARSPLPDELVLASRSADGPRWAGLLAACGVARVRFRPVDALAEGALERLLEVERPAVVVQCASLLSPWRARQLRHPAAEAIVAAGFAAQLPAQIPIIARLMTAVRDVGGASPAVVNCSYPDVTHPFLAAYGLAPTIGIGNAAMVQSLIVAFLRRRRAGGGAGPRRLPLVRVLAHHAQVADCLAATPAPDATRVRAYLGEGGEPSDDLAYAGPPLPVNVELNALSACSAAVVVRALLPGGVPVRLSLPGPLGLPGGFPVRVGPAKVALDLPLGIDLSETTARQWHQGRADGVQGIDARGRLHFTEAARDRLARVDPALGEPIGLDDAAARWPLLARHLGLA